MNRIKRIAALIGVFLLAFMYILTLFAALFDDGKTMPFLKASIALTILVPTLIWIFGIFIISLTVLFSVELHSAKYALAALTEATDLYKACADGKISIFELFKKTSR